MGVDEIENIECDVNLYVKEYGLDNTFETIKSKIIFYNGLIVSFGNLLVREDVDKILYDLEQIRKLLHREQQIIKLGIEE